MNITLVGSQLIKAALLALAYGVTVTLAAVRSRGNCCRPLAFGSVWLMLGSLGISFCCGPLVELIGVLGLASVATKLWHVSMGLMAATLLILTITLQPEQVLQTIAPEGAAGEDRR
jgi:hypothetical protein